MLIWGNGVKRPEEQNCIRKIVPEIPAVCRSGERERVFRSLLLPGNLTEERVCDLMKTGFFSAVILIEERRTVWVPIERSWR